jgi:hypothetical protein
MNQNNQVTTTGHGSVNAFEAYGQSTTQKSIVGTLLKFNKGDWLAGQNNDEVDPDIRLVANMDELLVGWIRWEDNKPTDQIMGRVVDNYVPPKRHELGDNDKAQWELDDRNESRDPWQLSNYLVLKIDGSAPGEDLYTFAAASRGSINAVGELCKIYGKAMRQRPDEFPVIMLDGDAYNHPNKAYGRIKYPIFKVVGWAPKSVFAEDQQAATEEASEAPAKEEPPKKAAATRKAAAAETTRF